MGWELGLTGIAVIRYVLHKLLMVEITKRRKLMTWVNSTNQLVPRTYVDILLARTFGSRFGAKKLSSQSEREESIERKHNGDRRRHRFDRVKEHTKFGNVANLQLNE